MRLPAAPRRPKGILVEESSSAHSFPSTSSSTAASIRETIQYDIEPHPEPRQPDRTRTADATFEPDPGDNFTMDDLYMPTEEADLADLMGNLDLEHLEDPTNLPQDDMHLEVSNISKTHCGFFTIIYYITYRQ